MEQKLKKYYNKILSIIIFALMILFQVLILKNNTCNYFYILTLIINPIFSAFLGIILSKEKNCVWLLIGTLLSTLLTYKEYYGYFNKTIIMYSIIYLALALLFMNTKASIKNKLQVTIVLSIMLITQFLVFNSIDFDNLEIMLYISLLLINPICSIILGILIVKETNLIWTLIGLPIIPLSIYFLLFNESFHWYGEIHQIVIIYSIIYLILGLLVTIINKFIKVKKIKWLISILLVAIIMIPTFIITINKEAIRDLKYYIKEWYDVDKGIITDYDNKKITIQNEYYEEYSTSYRDFNTNHNKNNLDINKINVGDKVIIDIISSGKKYIESVVTKKDDERQTIAFNSLFLIIDDLYKKDIRLITDDSGNKIKFNEVELNQKVKILSKRKSLMAYL